MDKRALRFSAGSMELKEGTGGITRMCPCGDFLEIYKVDTTFRVRTPESVDPHRTNPNAPWVASISDTVGSSSRVVARVLIQGHEILEAAMFDGHVDKQRIVQRLHACKESLVICERMALRIQSRIAEIIENVRTSGIGRDNYGRALNPFPQVENLEQDCTTFLINGKRAIYDVCALPNLFFPLTTTDCNFDHLAKHLAALTPPPRPLVDFVKNNAEGIRYISDLRNYQEHPGNKRTVITNFSVVPDGRIATPRLHLSDEEPLELGSAMIEALNFLVRMAESMLIYLVMSRCSTFPFFIEECSDEQLDARCPIKYRLTIDIGRLQFEPNTSK